MARIDMTNAETVDSIAATPQGRTLLRHAAGLNCRARTRIELVDGDEAPHYVGQPQHYTTRSGSLIAHPSAYSRRGWSSMVYHASTLAVRVGRDWRPSQEESAA